MVPNTPQDANSLNEASDGTFSSSSSVDDGADHFSMYDTESDEEEHETTTTTQQQRDVRVPSSSSATRRKKSTTTGTTATHKDVFANPQVRSNLASDQISAFSDNDFSSNLSKLSTHSDISSVFSDDQDDDIFKPNLLESSPYLTYSNFRPVTVETQTKKIRFQARELKEVPKCFLGGMFLQLGPNANMDFERTEQEKEKWRWLDGDGMLHALRFVSVGEKPQCIYKNRFIRTAWHEIERNEQKQCTEGSMGYFSSMLKWQVKSLFVSSPVDPQELNLRKDVSNICVQWHHNRLLTLGQGGRPHEISLPELGTVSMLSLNSTWKPLYFIPHMHVDPQTEELYFFAFSLSTPYLRLGCMQKDGRLRYDIPLDSLKQPSMFHDFALTDNFVLFFLCPMQFQVTVSHKLFGSIPTSTYDCTEATMLGVLRRHPKGVENLRVKAEANGEDDSSNHSNDHLQDAIRWVNLKSCYVSHIGNAYEEDADTLVICATKTPQYLDTNFSGAHSNDSALEGHKTSLYRLVVDLEFNEIREELLMKHAEYPTVRSEYYGSKNRFVYCMTYRENSVRLEDPDVPLFKSIVKIDLKTQAKTHYFFGSNRFASSECRFVPSKRLTSKDFELQPNILQETREDDGYLLCYVYDEISESSDLVVLDAKSMNEAFTISLPVRVPYGCHCEWVSRDDLSQSIPKPWK